jgi:hypothetical protein
MGRFGLLYDTISGPGAMGLIFLLLIYPGSRSPTRDITYDESRSILVLPTTSVGVGTCSSWRIKGSWAQLFTSENETHAITISA